MCNHIDRDMVWKQSTASEPGCPTQRFPIFMTLDKLLNQILFPNFQIYPSYFDDTKIKQITKYKPLKQFLGGIDM